MRFRPLKKDHPAIQGRIGIGEDDPDEEHLFRDLWEDETQREVVIESLKAYSAR
jgi:hypothetical protein